MYIRVLQDTMVITSVVRYDDLAKLERINPEALLLVDSNNDVVFRIKVSEMASMSKYGICFNGKNSDGYAVATFDLPSGLSADEKLEFIAESAGIALERLERIESQVLVAIDETNTNLAKIKNNIKILG